MSCDAARSAHRRSNLAFEASPPIRPAAGSAALSGQTRREGARNPRREAGSTSEIPTCRRWRARGRVSGRGGSGTRESGRGAKFPGSWRAMSKAAFWAFKTRYCRRYLTLPPSFASHTSAARRAEVDPFRARALARESPSESARGPPPRPRLSRAGPPLDARVRFSLLRRARWFPPRRALRAPAPRPCRSIPPRSPGTCSTSSTPRRPLSSSTSVFLRNRSPSAQISSPNSRLRARRPRTAPAPGCPPTTSPPPGWRTSRTSSASKPPFAPPARRRRRSTTPSIRRGCRRRPPRWPPRDPRGALRVLGGVIEELESLGDGLDDDEDSDAASAFDAARSAAVQSAAAILADAERHDGRPPPTSSRIDALAKAVISVARHSSLAPRRRSRRRRRDTQPPRARVRGASSTRTRSRRRRAAAACPPRSPMSAAKERLRRETGVGSRFAARRGKRRANAPGRGLRR